MLSDSVVGMVDNYQPLDQGKMLEEAIFFVKEQSYYMKKAIVSFYLHEFNYFQIYTHSQLFYNILSNIY